MNTRQIIEQIRGTEHDLEFYPTTYEMLETIYARGAVTKASVLDIGCGTCHFKKHFERWVSIQEKAFNQSEQYKRAAAEAKGERYYGQDYSRPWIDKYFVIEKSRPLIDLLDKDTICLGTDFHVTNLIDKPVDVVFCNPPYSEYETWAEKIIKDANASVIYLIIPQRWKDSERINIALKLSRLTPNVIGSFDFLEADRAARAKVDVIELRRERFFRKSDINENAFDIWFDETFNLNTGENDKYSEYEATQKAKEKIKDQISTTSNKASILVDLYNQEMEILFGHFKAICSLDIDVLEAIGIKKESVKSALKQRLRGLKILYWEMLFNELDEVTSRLTSDTRKDMLSRFSSLTTVEFCHDNIYPLVLWVIKNANSYYNDQLVKFYKNFSDIENVKLYKSNQNTFGKDRWRFRQEGSHYALDYRIIASHVFKKNWSGDALDKHESPTVINDICVIANNLGFTPEAAKLRKYPETFGVPYYINMADGSVLMEYKIYKNGNTHLKLNKEFAKAMNVEVARLLGWIRDKADIAKEFPEEMARGAEKYFKANNCISITSGNLPLLLTGI